MSVSMYVYMYVCMHVRTYVSTYVCMYVCRYIFSLVARKLPILIGKLTHVLLSSAIDISKYIDTVQSQSIFT
jgi:hypothetical protein